MRGVVVSEPDVREGSTRLTVDVSDLNGTAVNARVLVIARAYTDVRYGDSVTTVGTLRTPESFESGDGRSFNYPMYLAVRGISYEISFADVDVVAHGGNPFVRAVLAIKAAYILGLRSVLPEPYAGLAAGITAGDKRSVGSDLSDVFQRVSLVHILVLSGYNITVVLGAFMGSLARFSRAPRLSIVLLVVLFFYVISGGAASAARAGAMAFAAVFAKLYGRQFIAARVLIAIVFVMVLWNPYVLVFDPGFQLSVLATLGLIFVSDQVVRYIRFVPEQLQLREIASATVATQITVLPYLLYQNGMLSIVALPANLLALIAVPTAMAFSGIAALAGMLFGTWGTLFALPAYVCLRYIVLVADFFASLPFASVPVGVFSAWWLACIYAGIAIIVYKKEKRRSKAPPSRDLTAR
jgi:competence protein ComEC